MNAMDFVAFGANEPMSSRLALQFRAYLEAPAPKIAPRIQPLTTDGFIEVQRFGRIEAVPIDDVMYVQADADYTVLVRRDGRRIDHYKPIGVLQATLPAAFTRIHKSFLVRLSSVTRVTAEAGSRYFAILTTGDRLPVSRTRYRDLHAQVNRAP